MNREATVVLSPTATLAFPEGGGHWWVYLQYVFALRDLGARVVWLERCSDFSAFDRAYERLLTCGFGPEDVYVYEDPVVERGTELVDLEALRWVTGDARTAASILGEADLLVNFDYQAPQAVVAAARVSALMDIDPGLTQHWWSSGLIVPARHDHYVTTGETVGAEQSLIADCGVDWYRIRPSVHLPSWPMADSPASVFTTVTSWWGDEWIVGHDGVALENNKRVGFVPYFDLPRRCGLDLEIAAYFGEGIDPAIGSADVLLDPEHSGGDREDVTAMLAGGWRLRRSRVVAGDPGAYRSYVQGSLGEFSCVKPSCRWFQNAWISDRSLCYLASGRPVVVEDTGPSAILDEGIGLVRFDSPDSAEAGLRDVVEHYDRHREAARALAEEEFSAVTTLGRLLGDLTGTQRVSRSAADAATSGNGMEVAT